MMNISHGLILLLFISLLIYPVMGVDGGIVRTLGSDALPAGGTVEVTLRLPDDAIIGIVETIPDGFVFAATTHPENAYRVSGNQLIFSAIGTTEIIYTLRAEGGGNGMIVGAFEDFKTGTAGEIPASQVTAERGNLPAAEQSPGSGFIFVALGAFLLFRKVA